MSDWKTTVAGLGTALIHAWASGGLDLSNPKALVTSAGIALIGYLAKDAKDVLPPKSQG